jgi:RimJ/RimL family protein N-acetyltransferase
VDDVAAINNWAEADMPRDPEHEPQLWDAERVRMDERRKEVQGLRSFTVAAQSQATGELAGLTQLAVDPAEPAWGFQELTAMSRPHRGHRLGLLAKVAMLELLAEHEPQLTKIFTGNADANEHMIAINNDLGFHVLDEWSCFEVGVAQVLADPAPTAP